MLANLVLWLGLALELGTLAGLVIRRRARRLLLLPVLVVSMFVTTLLPIVWPATNTWTLWLAYEFSHAILALLMGLEIGLRLFFRIPEAQQEARRWILGVFAGLALIGATAPFLPPVTALLPATAFAVAWLYVGLLGVTAHHGLPIDPLHKTVLYGFSACFGVYALTWALTGTDTTVANTVNPLAFDLMMLALTWAAWRDDSRDDVPQETIDYFWPWRRYERPRRTPPPLPLERAGAAPPAAPACASVGAAGWRSRLYGQAQPLPEHRHV